MDPLSQLFYNLKLKEEILTRNGDAYEQLFTKILVERYKEAVNPAPWGQTGDKKCDGLLLRQQKLYAVYAPASWGEKDSEAKAVTKIAEDFRGGIDFWKGKFVSWNLVHSSLRGLPTKVVELLGILQFENEDLEIGDFGPKKLIEMANELGEIGLSKILGPPVNLQTYVGLRSPDIAKVIHGISIPQSSQHLTISAIPPNKIQYNSFSPDAEQLLKFGTTKANLVKTYLESSYDKSLGDRLAQSFNNLYLELRGYYTSDEILAYLQHFTLKGAAFNPTNQVAALAIIAHFTESCDVFDSPPGGTP